MHGRMLQTISPKKINFIQIYGIILTFMRSAQSCFSLRPRITLLLGRVHFGADTVLVACSQRSVLAAGHTYTISMFP